MKIADKTADFTAADGGAAAIALLNSAKTGAADSTWDNGTKTLTLRGIHFVTTATTAVKLPDGATVILADGTENRINGGNAAAAQDGKYQKQLYIYGIYAAGALTIQGETSGTGTLSGELNLTAGTDNKVRYKILSNRDEESYEFTITFEPADDTEPSSIIQQ